MTTAWVDPEVLFSHLEDEPDKNDRDKHDAWVEAKALMDSGITHFEHSGELVLNYIPDLPRGQNRIERIGWGLDHLYNLLFRKYKSPAFPRDYNLDSVLLDESPIREALDILYGSYDTRLRSPVLNARKTNRRKNQSDNFTRGIFPADLLLTALADAKRDLKNQKLGRFTKKQTDAMESWFSREENWTTQPSDDNPGTNLNLPEEPEETRQTPQAQQEEEREQAEEDQAQDQESLAKQLESCKKDNRKLKNDIATLNSQLEVKQQVDGDFEVAKDLARSDLEDNRKVLQAELDRYSQHSKTLQDQLDSKTKIITTMEHSLTEKNAYIEQLKKAMVKGNEGFNKLVKDLKAQKKTLEEEIRGERESREKVVEERDKLKQDSQEATERFDADIGAVKNELAEVQNRNSRLRRLLRVNGIDDNLEEGGDDSNGGDDAEDDGNDDDDGDDNDTDDSDDNGSDDKHDDDDNGSEDEDDDDSNEDTEDEDDNTTGSEDDNDEDADHGSHDDGQGDTRTSSDSENESEGENMKEVEESSDGAGEDAENSTANQNNSSSSLSSLDNSSSSSSSSPSPPPPEPKAANNGRKAGSQAKRKHINLDEGDRNGVGTEARPRKVAKVNIQAQSNQARASFQPSRQPASRPAIPPALKRNNRVASAPQARRPTFFTSPLTPSEGRAQPDPEDTPTRPTRAMLRRRRRMNQRLNVQKQSQGSTNSEASVVHQAIGVIPTTPVPAMPLTPESLNSTPGRSLNSLLGLAAAAPDLSRPHRSYNPVTILLQISSFLSDSNKELDAEWFVSFKKVANFLDRFLNNDSRRVNDKNHTQREYDRLLCDVLDKAATHKVWNEGDLMRREVSTEVLEQWRMILGKTITTVRPLGNPAQSLHAKRRSFHSHTKASRLRC